MDNIMGKSKDIFEKNHYKSRSLINRRNLIGGINK